MKKTVHELFAVTASGLEGVCAGELAALSMAGVRPVEGGVEFSGELRDLYRANLWLRTASRVLVRVGEVRSRDFPGLFRKCVKLPWGKFIRQGTRLRVRATSHRSRLGHSGRIAAVVAEAVDRALGRDAPPETGPEQLVLARFEEDVCLLSVDSSGELLHRRGYREESAHAPLRETLAAGMLLLEGWDGSAPLVDPMCGSGTLLIEGALLASGRAPGAERAFAFMDWPRFRSGLWEALLGEARRAVGPCPFAIQGSDRDGGAVAAARRNAGRAGVLEHLTLRQMEFSMARPPEGRGLILCNPPYGERVGKGEDLRVLFGAFGQLCREWFPGWRVVFLCPDDRLALATGLPISRTAALNNGGIPVGLFSATA